jgi:type I restriction enzyme M protein
MAKRHHFEPGDWISVFARLEEMILARSGEDPFVEILKLVVALLRRSGEGHGHFSESEGTKELQASLDQVNREWPELFGGRHHRLLLDTELAESCIQVLNSVEVSNTSLEVFDAAFETLHSRVSKGAKGQFFTPRHIIDACVKVLNPKSDEQVADTACGSAGFLVHALTHMAKDNKSEEVTRIANNNLWGFDFDQRAVDVARALMICAANTTSNIVRSDSLLRSEVAPQLLAESGQSILPTIDTYMKAKLKKFPGFDVILTNPPFAGDVQDGYLLAGYETANTKSRIERDVLFVERNVSLLKPGGRIAIVLPHNKVAGKSTDNLRDWLVRHLQVVAVLGLGRESFQPHTSQKAVVVFGQKRPQPLRVIPDEQVMFVLSEKSGKTSKGELLLKPGGRPHQDPWTTIDHDLESAVEAIRGHARELGLDW